MMKKKIVQTTTKSSYLTEVSLISVYEYEKQNECPGYVGTGETSQWAMYCTVLVLVAFLTEKL